MSRVWTSATTARCSRSISMMTEVSWASDDATITMLDLTGLDWSFLRCDLALGDLDIFSLTCLLKVATSPQDSGLLSRSWACLSDLSELKLAACGLYVTIEILPKLGRAVSGSFTLCLDLKLLIAMSRSSFLAVLELKLAKLSPVAGGRT